MRILWVKLGGLWPLTAGGRLRSFHMLSELSRRHQVTLLTTHGPGEDPDGLTANLPNAQRVISFPHTIPKPGSVHFIIATQRSWLSSLPVDLWRWQVPAVRRAAAAMFASNSVDLCVADFLSSTPNLDLRGSVPTVLFEHNVEHLIWKRLALVEPRWFRHALLHLEWRKMRRYEARVCAQADLTVTVSPEDKDLLKSLSPEATVASVSTGVDTAYFVPPTADEVPGRLVFTGSMDWYPNEDAILHFVSTILPRIRHALPKVSMAVVGRNPSRRLRDAARSAGILVTGTVPDVRPYVAEAEVYVVPLRIGGGTRLKIFEALAMAKAVVSTSVGAEGLPVTPGHDFLQADAPADFADAVVSLLRSPARRRSIGAAGCQLVQARYSWEQVTRDFESLCEDTFLRSHL